ncbi:MAG: hypothetical protein VXA40_08965 [Gammaproteobacteria bacterium]
MHEFDAIQRLAAQHEIFKRLNFIEIIRRAAAGTDIAEPAQQNNHA